jgi:hypothetical protein
LYIAVHVLRIDEFEAGHSIAAALNSMGRIADRCPGKDGCSLGFNDEAARLRVSLGLACLKAVAQPANVPPVPTKSQKTSMGNGDCARISVPVWR